MPTYSAPDSPAAARDFQQWPTVGVIEIDRFCEACGYNLRTQTVRRDPQTSVLMCRCPECARFHAAAEATSTGRAWLRRLASLLLLTWVLLILGSLFTLGLFDFAISWETFSELTSYVNVNDRSALLLNLPAGQTRARIVRQSWSNDTPIELTALALASLLTGLTTGMLAAVTLTHWSRGALEGLVAFVPLVAGGCVLLNVFDAAPNLMGFAARLAGCHVLLQVLGGVIGVAIGRPVARLLIRMFVPPSWRGPLAFLWLADGKCL